MRTKSLATEEIFEITESALNEILSAKDELMTLEADQDQIDFISEMLSRAVGQLFRLQAATRPQRS